MIRTLHFALALTLMGSSLAGAEGGLQTLDRAYDLAALDDQRQPAQKIDVEADFFLVPYFEVDTTNPTSGATTLIAIRNTTDASRTVSIQYRFPDGSEMLTEPTVVIPAKNVETVNLRDLGLPAEPDGFSRGHIRIIDSEAITSAFPLSVLTVDYFLVDDANNFAQGERALNLTQGYEFFDLCEGYEVRFTRGGAFDSTELLVYASVPQGPDMINDPPTLLITPYNEAGQSEPTVAYHTSDVSFTINVADITSFNFGALEIEFNNTSGHVSTRTSALGRFSVGFSGACTMLPQ